MDVTASDRHDTWRRALTVTVAAGGFLLVALATAWACTSQSHISSLEPSSAPAGAEVTVEGAEYAPGEKVEVRWEQDDGPLLATTTVDANGTFAVSVTLPTQASAGEHLVFAIAPDLYPAAGRGSAMIHVEGPEPAPEPATGPADEDTTAAPADSTQPAPAEEQPAPPAQAPVTAAQPAPDTAPAPETAPATPTAVVQPVTSSTDPGHAAVTAVSTNGPAATPGDAGATAPLPRAWEREPVAAAPPVAAPAWTGTPDDVRGRLDVGLGAGVLAVGLVVMFAGFAGTVLTGRRQRAEVPTTRD